MAIGWEVARQYKICLDDGDLPAAIQVISDRMRALPAGPFHVALNLEITDAPENLAEWLQSCVAAAGEAEPVRAVYIGLNGFDINTDLWFFQVFAYSGDPGIEDAGALIDNWYWCSKEFYAIEGLEPLQRVFAEFRSQIRSDAGVCAALLVLLKFFALVKAATALLSARDFPVMAGAANDEDKLVIP